MSQIPAAHFVEHQLGNGLHVLLHRDNRVPLVHVTVHYRVGSSYERPGCSGFAHLFEHMMFQGSAHVSKNEHGRRVDAAGGSWNATTSKDRTNYFETLPSHYLDLGLWLEADRMRWLKVTEENFNNQRQTVIEEKNQSYDNRPYGRSYLHFDELAYSNWAYGHPIIGSVEDLQNANIDDAVTFHRTYYGPGNATLVLAGDFEESDALEKIERYFGPAHNHTCTEAPNLREPEQPEEKSEIMQDPLAPLPAAFIGYHMPALGTDDHYALSILALILSQGESSRLYRRLIYDNNWITSLSAGPNLYKGPQLFTIWFQVQTGVEPSKVLTALEEELDRLRQKRIASAEMQKAQNQVLFRFVSSRNTVSDIGETLARYALYYDDPTMINREIERYLQVTAGDLRETAARTFQRRNRTLIEVRPGTG